MREKERGGVKKQREGRREEEREKRNIHVQKETKGEEKS